MNKVTKLSDLKTGMRVKVRNGYEYMVFDVFGMNEKTLVRIDKDDERGKESLNLYNENMEHKYCDGWSIVKVFIPKYEADYLVKDLKDSDIEVLYEREEKYEYTQQEKDIVRGALALGFRYIGRDDDSSLALYEREPKTREGGFIGNLHWTENKGQRLYIDKCLFENIKIASKINKITKLKDLLKEIEEGK